MGSAIMVWHHDRGNGVLLGMMVILCPPPPPPSPPPDTSESDEVADFVRGRPPVFFLSGSEVGVDLIPLINPWSVFCTPPLPSLLALLSALGGFAMGIADHF